MSVHLPTAEMVELTKKTKIIDDLLGWHGNNGEKAAQAYLFQMGNGRAPIVTANALSVQPFILPCRKPFRQMTGRVFFNPIDVADVTETVQALFDDVDLVGNNL